MAYNSQIRSTFMILIMLSSVRDVLSFNNLSYQILEELVPGTVIGDVINDAHLADDYTPSDLRQLRFDLLPRDHDDVTVEQFFSVEPTSGIIRIKSVIDRDQEQLCAYKRACDVNFDVAISPAKFFRMINVKVEILDINDNAPVFSRKEYRLNISETALPTTTYTLPSVFDLDSTDFGIRSIELVPDNDHFQVIWSQDLKGHVQPKLRLMKQLDREEDPLFDLTVVAYDNGTPANSAQLAVHVYVQDTNDNSPVFDLPVYEARIREDARPETSILSIHAQDPDAGSGGTVRYSLSAPTLGESITNFRIDPVSGDVYLAKAVDREVKDVYDMQVIATDQAKESRQAVAPLTVYIDDVNDNAPVIRINVITTSGRAEVSEAADRGTFVALVSVTDKDWGQNSEVTCTLNSVKFSMQVMQPNRKFKIVTDGHLDRERQNEYRVSVSCRDKGTPSLSSSQTFLVYVTDINDHVPVFSRQQYDATIEENSPPGVPVVKVTASDDDMADNAKISYRILNDYSQMFQIDPDSGAIRTRVVFDHEKSPEIRITVEARDGGVPVMSSTCAVLVKVADVNDLAPEFTSSRYTFMIKENQLTDPYVGRVSATDGDTGSFNKFLFSLGSEVEDLSELFRIEPDNGSIILLKPLDREARPFYYLTVIARDTAAPALSSTTTVTVFVEDVNDNAPVVDFPTSYNNTAVISNRLPPGYKVTQIRAHDPDVGDNAELSYFVVQDTDDETQRFGVDPKSGEVFLNYDLSKVKVATYHVVILVKDNGTPELSTLANLTVIVNQSAAVFHDGSEYLSEESKTNNKNMLIIIIVVAISGVIIIVLLASIVFVLLTSRRKRANQSASAASIVLDTLEVDGNCDSGGAGDKTMYNKRAITQATNSRHDGSMTTKEHQRYVTLSNQPSLNLSNNSAHTDQRSPARGVTGSKPPVPPRGVFVNYGTTERRPDLMPPTSSRPVSSPRRPAEEIDRHSATSSEDSITDSGRGASEEGENGEEHGPPRLPPKQPLVATTRRQPIFPKLTPPYSAAAYPDSELSLEYPSFLQPDSTLYTRRSPDPGTSSLRRQQGKPANGQTELLLMPDFGLSQLQNEFDPHYRLKYRDLYTSSGHNLRGDVTDPCFSSTNGPGASASSYDVGQSDVTSQGNYPANKSTVRSVKAKDKSKKADYCGSSLVSQCQPASATSSVNNLTGNSFNNTNSALRYNSQGGSTCSDITDGTSMTSATSGSYVVQHDDDDEVGGYSRNPVTPTMC